MNDREWLYLVTIETGVSIGPRRYTRVVNAGTPDPAEAARRALAAVAKDDPDNQLWQSDDVRIRIEKTA